MRSRNIARRGIIAAAILLGACATLGRQAFREPIVNFRDLQVKGVGVSGGTLDVVLSVYNPNNFKLDATRLTYKLMVDSAALGDGVYNSRFTVPQKDSAIIRLPVSLNYSGLGAAGRALLGKGAVNYRVVGDFTVGTPLGSFTRPYSQTGQFTTFGGTSRTTR